MPRPKNRYELNPRGGRPRDGFSVEAPRSGREPQFSGPLLSGEVQIPGAPGKRGRRRRRPKRSLGVRIMRWSIAFLVLLLALAGSGYAYVHWRFSQIHSVKCSVCVAPASGAPYNVLLIGSDSRQGETPAEAQMFGSSMTTSGERSDTIKIVHIDPSAGTAATLSIPRDTWVTLSGVPSSTGLGSVQKINAAFNAGQADGGANALIATIQNTFGIPISHFVAVNFFGLMDAVNTIGGIRMDFPYPVRDMNCNVYVHGQCLNESGLDVTTTGCQTLNGLQTLQLSRSRYFRYEENGRWIQDPTADIGRIQRQNQIVDAIINKATSTYNPIAANNFIGAVAHDITKDDAMTFGDMLSLAERYHSVSSSSVATYTLPTVGERTSYGADIEVVAPDAAQTIEAFLGGAPGPVTTPPLDAYGHPVLLQYGSGSSSATGSTASAVAPGTVTAQLVDTGATSTTTTTVPGSTAAIPFYDPRPC